MSSTGTAFDPQTLEALLTDGGKVLTAPDDLAAYGCDWTRIYEPAPIAVVLPKSTEEVQAIVRFANEHSIALVPSGGRTGLSAGAVAANGELVVAMDRMSRILDFNANDRLVRCEAGVVTEQLLQQYAEEQGLYYIPWISPPRAPVSSAAISRPTPVASR